MADMLLTAFPDEYNFNIMSRIVDRMLSADPAWPKYFKSNDTDKYQELMDAYSSFAAMGEWADGDDVTLDVAVKQYDYTLTQVFYGLGFSVSRKFREYHRFSTVQEWADSLGDSAIATQMAKHVYVLDNAFATVTYGDSSNLCATDHPGSGAATRSNELATPTALSVASWEALNVLGLRLTDYRGKPQPIRFDRCIVSPEDEPTALKLFGSMKEAFTTDNQENIHRGVEVIVEDQLTSTTAHFAQNSQIHELRSLWGKRPTPGYYQKSNKSDVFYLEQDFVVGVRRFEGFAGTAGA